MTNIDLYLTDEAKKRYMFDFEKLLNLTNSDFWDIDSGIKETLIQINKHSAYQTLYSKKYEVRPDSWNLGGESYLEIAPKKESWENLFGILEQIKYCLTCYNSTIEINECEPHDNSNLNTNSSFEIGCIKDPDYFRIRYIRISIESSDLNCHDKFWECIATKFMI